MNTNSKAASSDDEINLIDDVVDEQGCGTLDSKNSSAKKTGGVADYRKHSKKRSRMEPLLLAKSTSHSIYEPFHKPTKQPTTGSPTITFVGENTTNSLPRPHISGKSPEKPRSAAEKSSLQATYDFFSSEITSIPGSPNPRNSPPSPGSLTPSSLSPVSSTSSPTGSPTQAPTRTTTRSATRKSTSPSGSPTSPILSSQPSRLTPRVLKKPKKEAAKGASEGNPLELSDEETENKTKMHRMSSPGSTPPFRACRENTQVTTRLAARKHSSFDKVLIYPPPPHDARTDVVVITSQDLSRLEPDQFLNDSIIEFYLKYLINHELDHTLKTKCYFFNTFFYKQLTGKRDVWYKKVQKWTGGVDIFSMDYIFVPINDAAHWSLAIICHPGKVKLKNEDSDDDEDTSDLPAIIYLDSLSKYPAKTVASRLRAYLEMEWQEKKKTSANKSTRPKADELQEQVMKFDERVMPLKKPNVPLQDNFSDCGVFLLHYAEVFCRDPQANIDQEWFSPAEIPAKRIKILDIIKTLQTGQVGSNSGENSGDIGSSVEDVTDFVMANNRANPPSPSRSPVEVQLEEIHEQDDEQDGPDELESIFSDS